MAQVVRGQGLHARARGARRAASCYVRDPPRRAVPAGEQEPPERPTHRQPVRGEILLERPDQVHGARTEVAPLLPGHDLPADQPLLDEQRAVAHVGPFERQRLLGEAQPRVGCDLPAYSLP